MFLISGVLAPFMHLPPEYGGPVSVGARAGAFRSAMCSADEDCPEGIAYIFANEADPSGFCDVEERLAP